MLRRLRERLSYANVMSSIAVILALGTGGAYAANTIRSSDIVDGEIGSADIKDNSVNTFDVHSFLGVDVVDGSLTGADVADTSSLGSADIGEEGLLFNNTLTLSDIGSQSVGADEVVNNSLLSSDLSTSSVGSDEVTNNSLNDEDIGQSTIVDFQATIGLLRFDPAST